MLRQNETTECCIIKGAEGTVAGWQASMGSHGKPMLDTLFVKLTNPPKMVQCDGLPPNVVPITRCSTRTVDIVTVNRNQVLVLPNFAMTDYAAQGCTRPNKCGRIKQLQKPSILLHMSFKRCNI